MRFSAHPARLLARELLSVDSPARYTGGEFGCVKKENAGFRTGIGFPDLYEIGMSNQALRIIYAGLNALEGVSCERFFAPAPDFEALLRRRGFPLYGLELGTPLGSMDLIGMSLGYELCGTGILNILELSGIPLLARERGASDPLVIAGGPAASNPHPYAAFFDGVWIGEAEAGFFQLVSRAAEAKVEGAGRGDILSILDTSPSLWRPGKTARRAVHSGFGSGPSAQRAYPVPSLKPVQDHGVVEIMRGCPNGCRFCHAGYAYRPYRVKRPELILEEALDCLRYGGYREISLSSLSSADYPGIQELMRGLSGIFSPQGVSLQLPSLRVDSFTMPLLSSLSDVRKSGLTLAVETPVDRWRLGLNKPISNEKVFEILRSARQAGWRRAKLYFMLGLPLGAGLEYEAEAISSFLDEASRLGLELNVNAGLFVPKPHTPFERSAMAPLESGLAALKRLKASTGRSVKLSYHDPFVSVLEALISRGGEGAGAMILTAFKSGQRLEAWDEHRQRQAWEEAMHSIPEAEVRPVYEGFAEEGPLPWSDIDMLLRPRFLKLEADRSKTGELTSACTEKCSFPCGSCLPETGMVKNTIQYDVFSARLAGGGGFLGMPQRRVAQLSHRLLFRFSKTGSARFLSHLSVLEAFSKAIIRTDLPIVYSHGFNPQPRMEILQALSLGIESISELGMFFLSSPLDDIASFPASFSSFLPEGLCLSECLLIPYKTGDKIVSLNSLPYACEFSLDLSGGVRAPERLDPSFVLCDFDEAASSMRVLVRVGQGADEQALSFMKRAYGQDKSTWPALKRVACFTRKGPEGEWISFFDYFRSL